MLMYAASTHFNQKATMGYFLLRHTSLSDYRDRGLIWSELGWLETIIFSEVKTKISSEADNISHIPACFYDRLQKAIN